MDCFSYICLVKKSLQKYCLFLLLFIFSLNIVKSHTSLFLDLNEEVLEEFVEFSEKDFADEFSDLEVKSDYFSCQNSHFSFVFEKFNYQLISKIYEHKYNEPLLEIVYSPPEILS